jgi:hypothetical protein
MFPDPIPASGALEAPQEGAMIEVGEGQEDGQEAVVGI